MRDILVTGVGLVSGLGADAAAHWERLAGTDKFPIVDHRFAPYCVHPLGDVDFSTQVPKKSDLRQMEPWQRIGVFAAGLALADAKIAGAQDVLERTHLIVAAGSGERDTATDTKVLEAIAARGEGEVQANEILPSNLRPTLFLAQLSNLLAGNISIVHKVTGSSRTFMGEESAGFSAVDTAYRRIRSGQGDIFLVGGAFNSERPDILLNFELGGMLHKGDFVPVWSRTGRGGFAPASIGAFLVLEASEHAAARGAKSYGRLVEVCCDRASRADGTVVDSLERLITRVAPHFGDEPISILSGASGVSAPTQEERRVLDNLVSIGKAACYRAYGTALGHGVEAQFTTGVALAALAVRQGRMYRPFEPSERPAPENAPRQVLVTGVGHWRGEALALVEATERS